MKYSLITFLIFALLGCTGAPPRIDWPDGSNRIPINKDQTVKKSQD